MGGTLAVVKHRADDEWADCGLVTLDFVPFAGRVLALAAVEGPEGAFLHQPQPAGGGGSGVRR